MELNTESSLKNIRIALVDSITFPFKFVFIDDDDEEKEIQKEDEISKILDDILDGLNLHIKKEKINRKILGQKIDEKGDLQFYLFLKVQFICTELDCASNIMVVGINRSRKVNMDLCIFKLYVRNTNLRKYKIFAF